MLRFVFPFIIFEMCIQSIVLLKIHLIFTSGKREIGKSCYLGY